MRLRFGILFVLNSRSWNSLIWMFTSTLPSYTILNPWTKFWFCSGCYIDSSSSVMPHHVKKHFSCLLACTHRLCYLPDVIASKPSMSPTQGTIPGNWICSAQCCVGVPRLVCAALSRAYHKRCLWLAVLYLTGKLFTLQTLTIDR